MKEYYYLEGEEQKGPFSLEDLKSKGLTGETYVWSDDMDNWKKLKDLPDLQQLLKIKRTPPPPPPAEQLSSKTEVSGHVHLTKMKEPSVVVDTLKPTRKGLTFFLIWTAFHLFALLMSYSEIDFFNNEGSPRADQFWPIVEFQDCYKQVIHGNLNSIYVERIGKKIVEKCHFNGVFVEYDWTEFMVYVGGALIIFVIGRVSHNKNETQRANKN